jgi:hypothetical protein
MATIAHTLQLRSLAHLPAISRGQCCDLKIETSGERWWLCRLPVGKTDHRITIEKFNSTTGAWEDTHVFVDKGTK